MLICNEDIFLIKFEAYHRADASCYLGSVWRFSRVARPYEEWGARYREWDALYRESDATYWEWDAPYIE